MNRRICAVALLLLFGAGCYVNKKFQYIDNATSGRKEWFGEDVAIKFYSAWSVAGESVDMVNNKVFFNNTEFKINKDMPQSESVIDDFDKFENIRKFDILKNKKINVVKTIDDADYVVYCKISKCIKGEKVTGTLFGVASVGAVDSEIWYKIYDKKSKKIVFCAVGNYEMPSFMSFLDSSLINFLRESVVMKGV